MPRRKPFQLLANFMKTAHEPAVGRRGPSVLIATALPLRAYPY